MAANVLSCSTAARRRAASATADTSVLRTWKASRLAMENSFSCSVLRMTSSGMIVGDPFGSS